MSEEVPSQSSNSASPVRYADVTKRYEGADTDAVSHLDLEIPAGEICVLVGPSGCGKTTAMRMANRTVEMTSGDIFIGDRSVKDGDAAILRREIGYVIQQIGLFPHRTIAQNIGTVPKLGSAETRVAIEAAQRAQKEWAKKTAKERAAILRNQPDWPLPIVTTIEPMATWYPAEDYHQEYWNGEGQRNPYCLAVIPPKLAKLQKGFAEKLKG